VSKKKLRCYRKLLIGFTCNPGYERQNKTLVDLCNCLGKVNIGKPEIGEILTTGSLVLTLAKGVDRERVIDFLLSQQPSIARSITIIGLKYRNYKK